MTFGAWVMNVSNLPSNATTGSKSSGNKNVSKGSLNGQLNSVKLQDFAQVINLVSSKQPTKMAMNQPAPVQQKDQKQVKKTESATDLDQLLALLQSIQNVWVQLQKLPETQPESTSDKRAPDNRNPQLVDVLAKAGTMLQQIKTSFGKLDQFANIKADFGKVADSIVGFKQQLLDLQQTLQTVLKSEPSTKQQYEPAIQKILQSIQGWDNLVNKSGILQSNEKNVSQLQPAGLSQAQLVALTQNALKQTDEIKKSNSGDPESAVFTVGQGQNQPANPLLQLPDKIPVSSFAQTLQQHINPELLQRENGSLQTGTDGSYQFQIKLIPEGLGEVHVTITGTDSQMSIQLTTATDQAQQLLYAQSDQLKELLSTKGITLDSIRVDNGAAQMSFSSSQSSDQQNRQWENRSNGKTAKALATVSDIDMDDSQYERLMQQVQNLTTTANDQYPDFGTLPVIDTIA